jgi:formylglycine-generating enzyme required for sulfatase activity
MNSVPARSQSENVRMPQRWLVALFAVVPILVGRPIVAASEEAASQVGQTFRDCADCPEMVKVPAGHLLMGSSAAEAAQTVNGAVATNSRAFVEKYVGFEHPQHPVKIEFPFAISKYRVTRAEFSIFVHETGYTMSGGCTIWIDHKFIDQASAGWLNPQFDQTSRDPVVCVSWTDAKAYIAWLNGKLMAREGSYRLPSEAEWEYAVRAGTQTSRWWGDVIGLGNADCDGCGSQWDKQRTAPAGSFQTNAFGLSGALGNAWEWTEDCWNENYVGAPVDGRPWTAGNCDLHTMRGGSWTNFPWLLRSAARSEAIQDRRSNYIGFRVAKTLP